MIDLALPPAPAPPAPALPVLVRQAPSVLADPVVGMAGELVAHVLAEA